MGFIGWIITALFSRKSWGKFFEFLSSPAGHVAIVAAAFVVGVIWGTARANRANESANRESSYSAEEMDKRINERAALRMAPQIAEANKRAAEAEGRLNDYVKRNANNPSCVMGDDDLRFSERPSWLRIDPVPAAGSKPSGR